MIVNAAAWIRLILGLSTVFALFHWSASALGSDRGQYGLPICAIVIAATIVVERLGFGASWRESWRALGFGRPRAFGLATAVAISIALVLVVPAYAWSTRTRIDFIDGWPMLVLGLFAQAGIAEQSLFRGWLYGHIRRGRTFWRAATLSGW